MDVIRSLCNSSFIDYVVHGIEQSQDPSFYKELLTLGRYMGLPTNSESSLAKRTRAATSFLMTYPIRWEVDEDLYRLPEARTAITIQLVNAHLRNPLIAGAVIALTMIAPLSDEDIRKAKLDSIMKEVNVMRSNRYDPKFNWDAFFIDDRGGIPIHDQIEANPRMAHVVRDALKNWKSKIISQTHYPTLSNKLLPSRDREHLRYAGKNLAEPSDLATPASYEVQYLETGTSPEGPVQIGQRWYMNGLTPRTYFIAGGSAFTYARYLKGIFNSLVDSLSVSNSRNRVRPSRIHVLPQHHDLLLYDLTSFTSNLGCHYSFLKALASYSRNTEVTIVDVRHGLQNVNLGDLINEYAEYLNNYPGYYYDGDITDLDDDTHGVAGFLGVVGNIATCNFIHAAVLLQLAQDEEDCGCAGDDAAITFRNGTEEVIFTCVSLLGVLQTEKVYRTSEGDALYLKRRIELKDTGSYDGTLVPYLHDYIQWPSMIPFFTPTTQKRWREENLEYDERINIAVASISAFFSSVDRCYRNPHFSLVQASNMIQEYYRRLQLPEEGFIGFLNKGYGVPEYRFIPSVLALGQGEFIRETAEMLYRGRVELPCRDEVPIAYQTVLQTNLSFWAYPNPSLRLLQKLGIVTVRMRRKQWYYGEQGFELLLEELSFGLGKRDPQPCRYQVAPYIPYHLCGFLRVLDVLDLPDELDPTFVRSMIRDEDDYVVEPDGPVNGNIISIAIDCTFPNLMRYIDELPHGYEGAEFTTEEMLEEGEVMSYDRYLMYFSHTV